jgi:hypothetical protein
MRLEDAAKRAIKCFLFRGGRRPRRVKHGFAANAVLLLDRRQDLQREFGIYETECQHLYRRSFANASLILDVGASDGYSALGFASLARHGRIVAFEPDPAARALFQANLALNPALASRISLVPTAVGESETSDISLDEYALERDLRPDFIKIDVEGAELAVLSGTRSLMSACSPKILVEVHSEAAEEGCFDLLQAAGYDTSVVERAWWRNVYPEWRPSPHNRWLFASRSG